MTDKSVPSFHGSITALVTPMKDGKVDETAFAALVERQIDQGTHGVVPVGTTGESPTLTHEEHERVIDLCVDIVGKRIPVIAGAGSNATDEAIALAKHAESAGADGLLTVTGYYNKPSQAGLYAHFKAVHDAVSLPMVIYNVPGRTASDVSIDTLAKLSKLERVIAVKDATANLGRVPLQRLACEENFIQLSGEDITAVGFNAMGGKGCISVTANVAPAHCSRMQEACLNGDWQEALALQDQLASLHDALFSDTSPAPVKYALSALGLCSDEIRLPLVGASDTAKAKVDAALAGLDLV